MILKVVFKIFQCCFHDLLHSYVCFYIFQAYVCIFMHILCIFKLTLCIYCVYFILFYIILYNYIYPIYPIYPIYTIYPIYPVYPIYQEPPDQPPRRPINLGRVTPLVMLRVNTDSRRVQWQVDVRGSTPGSPHGVPTGAHHRGSPQGVLIQDIQDIQDIYIYLGNQPLRAIPAPFLYNYV